MVNNRRAVLSAFSIWCHFKCTYHRRFKSNHTDTDNGTGATRGQGVRTVKGKGVQTYGNRR